MKAIKISISIPGSMKYFIETRVDDGDYGSVSEYFRELIRMDQQRARKEAREMARQRPSRPPLASAARRGPEPPRYTPEEVRQIIAAREAGSRDDISRRLD